MTKGRCLGKDCLQWIRTFFTCGAIKLKDSKMKNLILIALIFLVACGSGSEDTLERPSVSPPDETEEPNETPEPEVPTPPETVDYDAQGTIGTRNLYDAEEIEVFYTDATRVDVVTDFKKLLQLCLIKGFLSGGYSYTDIGILSGAFTEQGYTKNFLLDPDVERTWSNSQGTSSAALQLTINSEFDTPFTLTNECPRGIPEGTTCKKFLCGAIKGD